MSSRFPFAGFRQFSALAISALLLAPLAQADSIAPQRFSLLEQAMQAQVEEGHLAGIATLVYEDGEVVHRQQHGYQDIASETPLAEDSLFKIYSLTKPVTAVALLMLVEEGKLSLDDPLEQHLPQFKGLQVAKSLDADPENLPTVPATHAITVRELMNYTAGFTYGRFTQSAVDTLYEQAGLFSRDITLEQLVDRVAALPLRHQPGTRWHYSFSIDIQARLVEVLSGQSFDDYLQERVLGPLGMQDTAYFVSADKADRLATSYHPTDAGLQPLPKDDWLSKPNLIMGGSGLVSSMDDYLRFARMLLNEGELDGVRLLKPETVQAMRSRQLPEGIDGPEWAPGNTFGLNVAVVDESEPAGYLPEGTFWWWGIEGPWAWIDPDNQRIVMGMMQSTDFRHSRVVHNTVSHILFKPAE
ncbi:serine hydrolase domain-containing protein [Halopseudomonas salegens]|uniref:CubicO group peptidase, beta-lactamase class C family n=1 Tax=Halopseudomonas salegens TaxID=1434072 RepID=A0A1H2G4B5_9GAMM|nr:serine hydrolase domain-containing protein [Halopseudomonas salegens]SDU14526.1 CubicO group peptidase, beta-lactamase class C family [Halopseudomonas salegens]